MSKKLQYGDPSRQDTQVIGNRIISAWLVAPRVVWIQTRSSEMAANLQRRSDSRIVATGVAGGYLRTFEFAGKRLSWAQRLIERYVRRAGTPNMDLNAPRQAPSPSDRPSVKVKRVVGYIG